MQNLAGNGGGAVLGVQLLVASADLRCVEDWGNLGRPYDAPAAANVVFWRPSTVSVQRNEKTFQHQLSEAAEFH